MEQIVFANLLLIPLIFLFTVPYIILTTNLLELYILDRDFHKDNVVISIKWKLAVATIYTFFGGLFLLFIFNVSLINSWKGEIFFDLLVRKNLTALVLTLFIALFNVILMIRSISNPISRMVAILKDLSEGEGDLTNKLQVELPIK